ncbi:MAG: heavy-metal-associated domain-containing protein [Clostridia bacterium]|nr:heavy-metal-associated domain-containing protein [Clostridia bacterium]
MVPVILLALIAVTVYLIVRKTRRGGGCCGEHEEAEKRIPVNDKNKSHYAYRAEMKIAGMTCENCARRVENALNSLDGVWAKVDIGSRKAIVRLKAPPDERNIKTTVLNAGYAVTEITIDGERTKEKFYL